MATTRVFPMLAAATLIAVASQSIAADADNTGMPAGNAPQTQPSAEGLASAVEPATVTKVFTVQKVDQATRTVTLKEADGSTREVTCGPEVRNFEQIKPGDQVTAAITEAIAVAVRPGSAPQTPGETQITSRAPQGDKPSGVMVQSQQTSGKVSGVDTDKRTITLADPSGKDQTMKVGSGVDLTRIKKGDEVTMEFVRAAAIIVGTPQDSAQMSAATMPAKD